MLSALNNKCVNCVENNKHTTVMADFGFALSVNKLKTYATVAQLAERLIRNQQVGGSIPPSSPKSPNGDFLFAITLLINYNPIKF